jgi:pimeloyl-ACP methyl ester carboxylesterase
MHSEILHNIHGIDTFLYIEGKGEPLIWLHGMAATSDLWMYVLDDFKSDRQVIAPDLPGHGRSIGKPAKFNLDFYTEWLVNLLDTLNLKQATLVGSSMGAAVSIAFAMKYPDRTKRLVLSDALGLGGKIPWSALRYCILNFPYLLGIALTRRVDPYLLGWLRPWIFIDPWGQQSRVVIQKMADVNIPRGTEVIRPTLSLLLADFLYPSQRSSFYERLAQVKIPTMIIWGQHDGLIPVSHASLGAMQMPNADVRIFNESSHSPMVEQPQLFTRTIQEFLGKSPKQRRVRNG